MWQLQLMKILLSRSGHKFRSIMALCAPIIVALLFGKLQVAASSELTDRPSQNVKKNGIHITADKLVAEIDASEIDFIGNVKARQGKVMIDADRLKVIYGPNAAGNRSNPLKPDAVRKIIADGGVKIQYESITAEANRAEYSTKSAILVLTGKPSRVIQDGRIITGARFTLHSADGTIKVESKGAQRVKAIFQPD
jgi:lipopolysaccharide transport protein LptA